MWIRVEKKICFFDLDFSRREIFLSEATWFAYEEKYVEAVVKNIIIRIFENEAGIEDNGQYYAFEMPDFKTEDDLIKAFCNKVIALLQNLKDDDHNSKSIVLFKLESKRKKLEWWLKKHL